MQHGRGLLQTGQVIQDIARDVTTCPINMALVLDKLWDTEDDADMLCLTSNHPVSSKDTLAPTTHDDGENYEHADDKDDNAADDDDDGDASDDHG
eukprot:3043112-Pyramimonas_sp.AAC.1